MALEPFNPAWVALCLGAFGLTALTTVVYLRRALERRAPGWYAGAAWVLGSGLWAGALAGALVGPRQWLGVPDPSLAGLAGVLALFGAVAAVAVVHVGWRVLAALVVTLGFGGAAVAILLSLRMAAGLHVDWPAALPGLVPAFFGLLAVFAGTLDRRVPLWRAGGQSFVAAVLGTGLAVAVVAGGLASAVPTGGPQPRLLGWLGATLLLSCLAQCALLLLLAWVEARLDARHRRVIAEVEQANVRLRREVIQRMETTAALAESEDRFRQAFDSSPVGMSILSPQRRGLRVNAALCALTGREPADLLGSGIADITHPDDLTSTIEGVAALEDGRQDSFTQEKRYLRPDGSVVHGLLHMSVARRAQGQVSEFFTQVVDVTARRQAEQARAESEALLRSAFEDVAAGMALFNPDGTIVRANRALHDLLGHPPGSLVGADFRTLLHADDQAESTASMRALMQGVTRAVGAERRFVRADGTMVWGRVSVSRVRDGAGHLGIMQVVDTHAQHTAQEALDAANAQLRAQVDEQERTGRTIGLLGEFSQMLQSAQDMAEAQRVTERFGPRLMPGTAAALYLMPPSRNYLEHSAGWAEGNGFMPLMEVHDCWALRLGQAHAVEADGHGLRCGHAAGQTRSTLCLPLVAHNETLGLLHLAALDAPALDAAARRIAHGMADRLALGLANLRLRENLRVQSIRDPLTGLYNRRFLEETLTRELVRAGRGQRPVAVLMMDVDHFKRFNDTHGHDAGDAVLRTVAAELLGHLRASDVLCRYGGEEFVAVLPEADPTAARERADGLRRTIEQLAVSGVPGAGRITMSVGVAVYPAHGADVRALLKAADRALYAAKGAGRNRVMGASEAAA